MIREIRKSFVEILEEVDWMDGHTKQKAEEKVIDTKWLKLYF